MRLFRHAALTLTAIALVGGATCTPALATFPGRNGLIVFATDGVNGCADPRPLHFDSIYTISPDGTNLRRLGVGFMPNWSPDGKWIAYIGGPYVGIMRANGTHKRHVHFRPALVPGYPAQKAAQVGFTQVSWSPDGGQLLAIRVLPSYQTSQLVTFPAKARVRGSDVRIIASSGVGGKSDWSVSLPAEPAGLVAFDADVPECNTPPEASTYIFLISPFGGAARRLSYPTSCPFPISSNCGCKAWFEPSWDPSGGRLAFTTSVSIFMGDSGGNSSVQLTTENSSGSLNPAWSPQGDAIVFSRRRSFGGRGSDLYLVDPSTPLQETLIPNTVCGDWPAWQPLKF
jgi:hypothetical protein